MEGHETIGSMCGRALALARGDGAGEREIEGLERAAGWLAGLYVEANGTEAFSARGLDAALGAVRADYESGRVYEAACSARYRIAAAVEDLADYGEVGGARLPPWRKDRNPLLGPAADSARGDRESVTGLALAVLDEMGEAGYARSTIGRYRNHALPKLVLHARGVGADRYSDGLIDGLIAKARGNGWFDVAPGMRRYLRPAALHVRRMHDEGTLRPASERPGRVRDARTGPFGGVIAEFEAWRASGGAKPKTVKNDVAAVAGFLERLRPEGPEGLAGAARERVRAARTALCDGKPPRAACRELASVRAFAEARRPEVPAFGGRIGPNPRVVRTRPIEGYAPEQAEAVVASADGAGAAGTRDAAMLALLKSTGMRACDAAALTVDDISWREGEIRMAQAKTGVPIALPLDAATGDAIARYLLEARRECGSRALLVTAVGPARPLSAHAFRRGLGTALVAAGVPLGDVADVLGHSGPDAAMQCVTVAVERLRTCCAGLDDIAGGRGPGDA